MTASNPMIAQATDKAVKQSNDLPYRYHERRAAHQVGGWRLPSTWQFDSHIYKSGCYLVRIIYASRGSCIL
ncbi:hypothetical protein [Moraxella catarrhalis]|uniref:hypothetical protein n=1 Tax=Moraxella catarrhalis TaxID=480 RepID=UPI00217E8DEE|nr:hypothetical protein [Moraxella catarrhalis]